MREGDEIFVHSMDRLAPNLDDLRQTEGIALAKTRGVYKGRKPALTTDQARELIDRARSGEPKTTLAAEYGVSRATFYTYLRAATS